MSAAEEILQRLRDRGWTLGVAESLTGGLLADAFVQVPGASAVLLGGVVAYATPVKHTVLGVDADLLAERGPIDPQVAEQMADGVRRAVAVAGRPADIGLSTTGVAGPDAQGGKPPGTVFVGLAIGDRRSAAGLELPGDRVAVRLATVAAALTTLLGALRAAE
jgi:nicotinamide-nucleotide amidase